MKALKYIIALWVSLLAYQQNSFSQCVPAPVPNDACYQQVILVDPFCCNTFWDGLCQSQYDALGCTGAPPGCAVVAPVPDDACYQMVISTDPNCCDVSWDPSCQTLYDGCTGQTYGCSGGFQQFVVPPCITEIFYIVDGAQGGGPTGGGGASISGTMPVIPGQTLFINVGCQGGTGAGSGGYPAGGNGQNSGSGWPSFGGGGLSMISTNAGYAGAVVIAGGGGGTGAGDDPGNGGAGGCPNGTAGGTTYGFGGGGGSPGTGGTGGQPWTAGGGAGQTATGYGGGDGGIDIQFGNNPGGGGGAGYFGGGGGGSDNISGTFAVGGGGGGGGGSLVPGGAGCNQGANMGDGQVQIAWGCETTPPTASNPAPINAQCPADVPAPNPNVVTDEADNCDPNPVVAFVSDVSDGNTCPETITRTYSVTDVCLNQITVTQTITINDTQAPVFAAPPANVTVQCIGDVPAMTNLGWTDNCDGAGNVAGVDGALVGGQCGGTITRTWTYTDACGNTATETQIITVNDNIPPTGTPPANANYQCIADVPAGSNLQITDEADNCTVTPTVFFLGDVSDGNTCPETITRSWMIQDNCGNQTTISQTIIVEDTQAPVFAAPPADITVQCPGDVPGNMALAWTDNCDGSAGVGNVDVSDGNTCPETITRTWTYTDACGNTATETQMITVNDTQAPVFAAPPANVTVECGNVPAMTNLNWTDNCDGAGNVVGVDVSDGNTCPETITRTWTYTDACGNTATETQTITVDDTQPPVFSAPPANATVECVGDIPAMTNLNWTDNCDGAGSVAGTDGPLVGGSCGGTVTRTWTYTDVCGNTSTVTQTFTIDDTTPPTASNPPNINITTGSPVPGPDPLVVTDEADNCDPTPTVTFVSDVSDNGNCPETITRTYEIEDDCGNTTQVTQLIIIGDGILPTASNPPGINVECIGDVPAPDPAVVTDEADNGGPPVVAFDNDVSDGNTCPETITRTYSVTDDCGNVIFVTQTITVNDITPPVFAAPPANVTVECASNVPAMTNLGWTDNCDGAGNVLGVDVSDGNTCPETITRTWTYTDACGNTSSVSQTITVDDTTPPLATAPGPVTVECIGDVPASNIADVTGVSDNCTAAPVVAFVSDVSDNNTCPETITRTYSITDDCGNVTTVTQTITVDDTTPPTASNPGNINITQGNPIPPPDPAVVTDEADNCDPTPTVTFISDVSDNGNCPETITRTYEIEDNCGNTIQVTQLIIIGDAILPTASNPGDVFVQCIGDVPLPDPAVVTDEADNGGPPVVAWESDVSDGNTCPETITRTYSVTDDCGNVIFVTHDIVVQDLIPPSGSAPGPANYECIGDVPPGVPGDVTGVSDNCTANPAVAYIGDVSDGNTCPETILRSWTITDDCGNVTQVDQQITVDDVTPPLGTAPTNVTVECIGDVPPVNTADVTGVSDNCTAVPAVNHVGDVSDGNTCPETITRTYEIVDDCGNITTVTQTITVDDTTPPTASNPATTTVPGGPAPAPDPNVVIDEADNCGTPTVAFVSQVSDNNPCPETITYTYSVTDDCGNTINVTHDVLITDPILPTATAPADINVECITAVPAPDPLLITDEADNNGVPTVTWASDVSDGNTCPETITRTYDVTDQCGNVIQVAHNIIVQDVTPPTGTAPAPVAVECIGDVPPANILDITDEADNCGTPTVAHVGDVSDGNTCPETITRTYSITDSCGNSITVDQIITVDDITPPLGTAPANVTVECIGDVPPVNTADVTGVSDNCTAVPAVNHVGDVSDGNTCPETITRTYEIVDDCGNVTTVTQDIIVDDTTPPTASNPATTTIPGGPAPAPDPNVVIDEADNCTATPTVAFVSQVSDNNPCPETITYTYSVTDDCGNTINVTHDVIITDPILPTGTAPANVTVECIGDVPAADPLLITDEADNNGVPTVTWNSDVSDGNTCPETITRTYDITDICGNVTQVTQTITVDDTTLPTATAPAPINVECIGDVPAANILDITDEADNCTANPTVVHVGDVSDGNTCPEIITRTYSITDDCGNQITVDQIITVDDITPPTGTAPANVTVECIGDVPAADPLLITDEADNCTANPAVNFVSDVSDGNTCPEVITRTYEIVDDCGNVTQVTQTITVDDTTNPTASNPASITVPGGPAPAPDPLVVIDEADNCTANPIVAFVSDVSDGNPCPETITRTYSVTDDCGNTINVTQDIIITDPIDPTGTAPANITVECIGDVPAPDPLLITDEADNQPFPPVVAHVSDVSDGNTCPETITRTYSITDICGNQITVTQTITVDDTTNPTASNPAGVTVQCIGDVPAPDVLVVTDEADNCTANPVVAHVSDVSDGNTCPEIITRTYSVTDDCGNSINVTQAITVDDTTDPTASNPTPINVECIADVPAPDVLVVTDEADNCTANPVVAHVSDVSDGGSCPETITRTYSVTDDCGNTINVTQAIMVNDVTNPTASNPATINVPCASNVPAPDPTVVIDEADNCTANPTVTWVGDVTDGNVCNAETITRTYEITDDCNNSIQVTQTIIIDVLMPTVDAGVDQAICEGESVTLNATTNAQTFGWDNGVTDGTAFIPPVGTITYTVTANNCGTECFASDQVDVTVNPLPVVSFVGDTLYGCEPHTVDFVNTSTEQGNCVWDFGDGTTLNDCGPVSNIYDTPGLYDVTLTVTSPQGCVSTDTYTDYVEVAPFPEAAFTFSPTDLIITDTEVDFTNESINADFYDWDFGDQYVSNDENPTHTFPEIAGNYTVTLTAHSNAGCSHSVEQVVIIKDELIFYVPNVITPDANSYNDIFKPVMTAGVEYYNYHLTIFNRWGEIVFESYNYDFGWNGHYGNGGLVQDGVYVWQIEFKETMSDKKHKYHGHVTVLK